MRQDVQIRPMEMADIPEVLRIEEACFSEPWTYQGFVDALASEMNLFVVAVVGDGQIAGYCGLYTSLDEGEITNVAVENSFRRQGVARCILDALIEKSLQMGISQIFLEVRASNVPARSLYSSFQFEDVGVRKNFYRLPTEDAIVMCRKND